jgi:hypothetical protein
LNNKEKNENRIDYNALPKQLWCRIARVCYKENTLKPGGKRLIFTELMDKYFPEVKG